MRHLKTCVFALVCAIFLAPTGNALGNILVNGDFENGTPAGAFLRLNAGDPDLTGWTILPDQIDLIGTFFPAASGIRSVDLDGNVGVSGGIAQTIQTTVGNTYNLTFQMAGNLDGGPAVKTMTVTAAGVSMDFSFDTTGNSPSDLGWEPRTWTFTATEENTTLSFISTTSPAGYGAMVDDVVLVNANPGVEVLPLPPGDPVDVIIGMEDPRDPKVRVGIPESLPPAFYVRRTADTSSSGKVEVGECYNTYFDGRGAAASGFLCGPLTGIDIWRMSVSMYFPEAGDITLTPKLYSSTFPVPTCQVPDAELCSGPSTTFTIDTPGTYTLSMPFDCVCALLDDVYFLTICIVDKTTTVGPFITTSATGGAACLSYVDLGAGWEDVWIKFPSLPGPFQVSGTAACCEAPIGVHPNSWGDVKSKYGKDQD